MFFQKGLTVSHRFPVQPAQLFRSAAPTFLLIALSAAPTMSLTAQEPGSVEMMSALQARQDSLQQTVESLEASGDIWHPMIAESMTNLGSLLQQAGRQ